MDTCHESDVDEHPVHLGLLSLYVCRLFLRKAPIREAFLHHKKGPGSVVYFEYPSYRLSI